MAPSASPKKVSYVPEIGDWLRITYGRGGVMVARVTLVKKTSSPRTHRVTVASIPPMCFTWRDGEGCHGKGYSTNYFARPIPEADALRFRARAKFWKEARRKAENVNVLLEDTSLSDDDKDRFTSLHGELSEFCNLLLEERIRREKEAEAQG